MELFIFLLIIGYLSFFKGLKNPKKDERSRTAAPQEALGETGEAYAQQTFWDEAAPGHEGYAGPQWPGDAAEGVDPCHDRMYRRPERIAVQEGPAESGWLPDLSAEGLRQAVVMQEILTRPCDRLKRYRG